MDNKEKKAVIGDNIVSFHSSWDFGGIDTRSFISHMERSIPLYRQGHQLVCDISDFFVQEDSIVYELGVSTGELLKKLASRHRSKQGVRWIGIDSEANMISAAQDNLACFKNVELVLDDVVSHPYSKSDLIISYYCIQFVRPRFRQILFDKIFESLNWGGAFVLFEKVRAPDARFQDIATALYSDFKSACGYSDKEILDKARSLRGVLEPYSSQANLDYLSRAGFKDVMTIMKYVCFEGFLAIK